ncbi:MAG: hypothetical protein Q8P16_00905 [bacterium]|nr:hypothetical protein [bacterium]
MAQTKKKSSKVSTTQKVGIGVGLTAAAVAAAGTYFLYGSSNAPRNRKKVKSWMLKAKAEVLEALERAEDMTQKEYEDLIDSIGRVYGAMQDATRGDVADFKKEMKGHWSRIRKSGVAKKITARAALGTVRSGAKKASPKASKKSPQKRGKKTAKKNSNSKRKSA